MAKQTLRIDSGLESFLHSIFRTVVPIYPAKAPARKRQEAATSLAMFDGQPEEKGWVMVAPFQYEPGTCQTIRPCLLVVSSSTGVQCLPGRTCDLRQGIAGSIVYQIGIEGDFLAPAFKRAMQQVLTSDSASVSLDPDFSFLPRLVSAFPALGKEVNKLEEERRVWKIEQLDDPAYFKTVDRALKRVLDKLFVVGKDTTDKKGVYQAGINALLGLQKLYKTRLEAVNDSNWNETREWQILASVLRTTSNGIWSLSGIKIQAEMNEELGKRLQKILAEYFRILTKKDLGANNNGASDLTEDVDIMNFMESWKAFAG